MESRPPTSKLRRLYLERRICTPAVRTAAVNLGLLVRVQSKALQNVTAGRIFAADDDVPYVDDRDDVASAITECWWREHAGGLDALSRIREAQGRTAATERHLDAAVAGGRGELGRHRCRSRYGTPACPRAVR
jgi:hypothetical protein